MQGTDDDHRAILTGLNGRPLTSEEIELRKKAKSDRERFKGSRGGFTMENILTSVEAIINTFDQINTEYDDTPRAGSQMEKEIDSYPDKPRINEPFNFAKLNLKAAQEQLAAMPDLIRSEKFFTNPVAARAVLESATLALWLLETGIDEGERVKRGLIQLCDGKKQLKKFHNEDSNTSAVASIDDFFATRLPAILRANDIVLPPKPNIVDMIRQVLGDEFRLAYRILSGFAHGQPNIMYTFAYDFENANGTDGMKSITFKPKATIQLYSFDIAVKSYAKALEAYFAISGWEFSKIRPRIENFHGELAEAAKKYQN